LKRSELLLLALSALPVLAQTQAHAGNAVRLMQERRFADAAAEFETALASDPNNDSLRLQYATCLYAAERNDQARQQFEIEQKRLGAKPGISYYLGILDLRTNKYAAAIATLKPLEGDPAFPKAPFYLGMAYLGAGQTGAAMDSLQLAAKNNPHDTDVHYRLARLYTAAGRSQDADLEYKLYRGARETERIIEEQVPPCMEALRTQPLPQAKTVCAPIGDPNDSNRLTLLGRLYTDAGALTEAIEPLQQAARLDPKSFEAWQYLGMSFYGLKRYSDALEPLKRAEALNPRYFDVVNLLARTLYAMGDYKSALPVLERAHNLNPDDAQLAGVLDRLRKTLAAKP
jgi:tetratricopeptide (TPR) repeat protein